MPAGSFRQQLARMPKIELHLHLDGSLRPRTAMELAGEAGLFPERGLSFWENALRAPEPCRDLNDYLTRFELPLRCLQTGPSLRRAARELAEDLMRENVIYAEIRFAPQLHTKGPLTQRDAVLAAAAGLGDAGVSFGLILCCMRGAEEAQNRETIETAAALSQKGVCGVDLAGAEALYPTREYASLFRYARELGLPITIHAGEAAGPESIRAALELGACRIGHGIRAAEDPALLERLRDAEVLLECCPISNVQTHAASSMREHPFLRLYQSGTALSISTDNRTVSSTCLMREYAELEAAFSLPFEAFLRCNQNAARAAFLPQERRDALLRRLSAFSPGP